MHNLVEAADAMPYLWLFDNFENNLIGRAYARGYLPGRLWVDDRAKPTCGLMWDGQDWVLLSGHPYAGAAEDLRKVFAEAIAPGAIARGADELNLYANFDVWREGLAVGLADYRTEEVTTSKFVFAGLPVLRPMPKAGDHLVAMDRQLLAQTQLENYSQMKNWIVWFWRNLEEFTQWGIGYALLRGDSLMGWCLSVVTDGEMDEIGIATASAYRGQGVAQLVATAMIEDCLRRGRKPIWHCDAGNKASEAVAQKVGFRADGALPTLNVVLKA